MREHSDLPIPEYAFPGPLRDRLVAAIVAGEKTATTSLLIEYELEGESLPSVGARAVVVDSAGEPVGTETITGVRVARIGDVDLEHAVTEGEGFSTVAEWRAAHEGFWHSDEFRSAIGDPTFMATDDTMAVLARFRFAPL